MASLSDNATRRAVPAILIGSLVFCAVIYLGSHDPELFADITDSMSGTTAMADAGTLTDQQSERDRIARINALLVSDQNKRDLKEGRPFWSATPALVDLAFAATAEHTSLSTREGVTYEFHEYLVGGVQRVVAEFHNAHLSCMHYAADGNSICNSDTQSYYSSGYPFASAAAER